MTKTAIVTGGSRGIGYATAAIFAQNNFNVAICARNAEQLESAVNQLKSLNAKVKILGIQVDVTDKLQIQNFATQVLNEFSKIDVLVNNAGLYLPGIAHTEEEGVLEKLIETNVYSAYYVSRAFIPKMKENQSGSIFNICSVASLYAIPNGGSYAISKFAMLGLGKVLRSELKTHQIKVTNIMAGATLTSSFGEITLPEERFMKSADIAETIYNIYTLSDRTVVEDVVLRPQMGDL